MMTGLVPIIDGIVRLRAINLALADGTRGTFPSALGPELPPAVILRETRGMSGDVDRLEQCTVGGTVRPESGNLQDFNECGEGTVCGFRLFLPESEAANFIRKSLDRFCELLRGGVRPCPLNRPGVAVVSEEVCDLVDKLETTILVRQNEFGDSPRLPKLPSLSSWSVNWPWLT
jgi:hypothetical protein